MLSCSKLCIALTVLIKSNSSTMDTVLWNAIHIGVKNTKAERLIIIVDGLDDRRGHKTATAVSDRIGGLARPRVMSKP